MSNPLEELEERFDAFIELKDPEGFFLTFAEYLRFIQETPPLNTIARKILFSSNLSEINNLYKTLQRAWQEDDKAAEKIWEDINRKFLRLSTIVGRTIEYDVSLLGRFSERQIVRGIIRVFHTQMVEGTKQAGLTKKKTVILHLKEARICLQDETPRCYSMRLTEGMIPERFEIIIKLLQTKTGKAAGDIAKLLGKDSTSRITQDNIKKEIRHINKRFQKKLGIEEELIIHIDSRGKNIYFLNTENLIFHTEK